MDCKHVRPALFEGLNVMEPKGRIGGPAFGVPGCIWQATVKRNDSPPPKGEPSLAHPVLSICPNLHSKISPSAAKVHTDKLTLPMPLRLGFWDLDEMAVGQNPNRTPSEHPIQSPLR